VRSPTGPDWLLSAYYCSIICRTVGVIDAIHVDGKPGGATAGVLEEESTELTSSKDNDHIPKFEPRSIQSPICRREDIRQHHIIELIFRALWQQKHVVARERHTYIPRLSTIELEESRDIPNTEATNDFVIIVTAQVIVGDDTRDDDSIADFEVADFGSDGMDNSDNFMAHCHGWVDWNPAMEDVEVSSYGKKMSASG